MRVKTSLGVLTIVWAAVGIAASANAQFTEEQQALVRENFKGADVDADGALTRAEFEAFMRANADDNIGATRRIVRFNAFDRAFGTLDEDANGVVTLEEFQKNARERAG